MMWGLGFQSLWKKVVGCCSKTCLIGHITDSWQVWMSSPFCWPKTIKKLHIYVLTWCNLVESRWSFCLKEERFAEGFYFFYTVETRTKMLLEIFDWENGCFWNLPTRLGKGLVYNGVDRFLFSFDFWSFRLCLLHTRFWRSPSAMLLEEFEAE